MKFGATGRSAMNPRPIWTALVIALLIASLATAFCGNYTVEGCPPADHYQIAQIDDNIVPGITDTGNHCDDCVFPLNLPFSYVLYDQTFTHVSVDSNGTLQFINLGSFPTNDCLPSDNRQYIVFPYWD